MDKEDITLILGDCLEEMPKLTAASVDLILSDLPYGTTRKNGIVFFLSTCYGECMKQY